MTLEERTTHRNLGLWMQERAKSSGVKEQHEDDDADDPELMKMLEGVGEDEGAGQAEEEEEEQAPPPKTGAAKKEEEEEEASKIADKQDNFSAVNLVAKESKMNFRGVLTPVAFTNWLWYRCVRPKMEETKSKLPSIDDHQLDAVYGIDDVEEILGEFMPKESKKEEKADKKDKKDKKDKAEDKKDDKKKKNKKDAVTLNSKEKIQAQNLMKNMVFGESGKGKTIVSGWVNMLEE